MKIIQRVVAILSVIFACIVLYSLLVVPTKDALVQSNSVSSMKLSDNIPANPNRKQNPEETFGNFAWETFIALNWPADCNGSPKKGAKIGQDPDAPRVWEFYNFPEDVFKPNGAKPNPQPVVPHQCQSSGDSTQPVASNLQLTEFALNPILPPAKLKSNQEDLSILIRGHEPLVDRRGNYILNEPRMNPIEVKQIVSHGWYSEDNLAKFNNQFDKGNPFELMCSTKDQYGYPNDIDPLVPCSDNRSEGVIELKAAWMVFPDSVPENLQSQYYTTKRTFYVQTPEDADGEKTKVTTPLGLVGFHILQKTSYQGWIWATFEHINNAPGADDEDRCSHSDNYNLFDPTKCKDRKENKPLAKPPYLWRHEFPHAVTKTKSGKIKEQTPSQITRLVSIDSIAQSLNREWQPTLEAVPDASVWQNYQLIGVQWLENPDEPYVTYRGVKPATAKLANVTLEPYVQKTELGNSCIACHSLATLPPTPKYPSDLKKTCADLENSTCADFSFLMGRAENSSTQARK